MPGPPSAHFIFFWFCSVPSYCSFFSSCQIHQDVLSFRHVFSMGWVHSVVHRSTLERDKLLGAVKGDGEMVEGDAKC